VRIRNLCADEDTTYTYDTNVTLSRLLCKTTNGITTKYVYGRGLIGEEVNNTFKIYHFDFRGSTVAITDMTGNITDTFKYDTYGKMISRTGTSSIIFGYNGRDGVVTDKNGLLYMRARYYSPEMKRFINADIVHGEISDSTSLNRYSYVNGNPVSFTDPFGLAKWWQNALKIAAGVAVIATLAVVSVATAGTATAVIASAAAVGGAIGGGVGAVSGYIENGIDGAANGFLVNTISGAVSGALGASTLRAPLVAAGNAVINVGEIYMEDVLDDGVVNEVDSIDVMYAAATGVAFNNFNNSDGLLVKGSKLASALELQEKTISKEMRRANKKYAKKSITRVTAYYDSIYKETLGEYAYKTLEDEFNICIMDDIYENVVRSK